MRRISSEEAQKYVPYERYPLAKDPEFYTIEVDSDGWDKIKYYTKRLRQSIGGGKGDQYVYVLSNKSMPGMLKIGFTTNEVDIRAEQLSRPTGVPTPYDIEYTYSCFNAQRIEHHVHKKLEKKRVKGEKNKKDRKEFFYVDLEEAKKIIEQIGKEYD
jgi:hypothetical protein